MKKNSRVVIIVASALIGSAALHYLITRVSRGLPNIVDAKAALNTTYVVPQTKVLDSTQSQQAISPTPTAPTRAPLWAFWVGGIWFLTWATPAILGLFELDPKNIIQRFGNGLFLTNTASVGYFLFKDFVTTKLKKKRWPAFETSWWMLPGWYFSLIVVAAAWPAIFYGSWTGDSELVGLPFGIGALISGFLFRYGPERITKFDDPSVTLEHKSELRELLRLERAVEKHEAMLAELPNTLKPHPLDFAQYLKDRERIGDLRRKWDIE